MVALRIDEDREDGRTLRAVRSRNAIIDAMYDLIETGVMRPTAKQVADRAGVGIRTVFRHFDDMHGLHVEVARRVADEAGAVFLARHPEGDFERRWRDLIACRVAFFEKLGPFKRCEVGYRWTSPYLQKAHSRLVATLREDLFRWLPELARADEAVVAALDLWLCFEAWERLRTDQGLDVDRAAAVLERGVESLLGASPPAEAPHHGR
jgi:AcrR family transcriptional regulator